MDESQLVDLLEPAATRVRDPISGRSVWLAGLVRQGRLDGETLRFDLVFSLQHTTEMRKAIEAEMTERLREVGWSGPVSAFVRLEGSKPTASETPAATRASGEAPAATRAAQRAGGAGTVPGMHGPGIGPHGGPVQKRPIEGVRRLIAVASGKGGVGKSTVATNLAVGLKRLGYAVGLLDADVYGPSLPKMMGTRQRPLVDDQQRIVPVNSYGVRCMSSGLLVPEDEAMIWRGPMVQDLVRKFLQQVKWGDLDYLVVDLPPGTGDAQLTLIQGAEIDGAVVVTTPQDVALADAIRGVTMFRKLGVPLLGVVENMAWYELPDGTRDHVFGEGGGRRVAEQYQTELLAEIPLRTALRKTGDQGLPAALGDDSIARAFEALARKVAGKLPLPPQVEV